LIADQDTLHSAAARYLAAGLCALPARRAEKRPAVGRWKQYRKRLPTSAEVSAWFANGPGALCIICGRVSGNGEMIDFDAGGESFEAWAQRIPPDLLTRLVIETTQRGGRHVWYRCEAEVCGNMKLAQRLDGANVITLIETRGEGGLFLCAPTAGYELIQGDLANPPVLTTAERDVLLQSAWDLNEYLPPAVDGPSNNGTLGPRGPSSGGHGQLSAENSHSGSCPSDNGIVGQRGVVSIGHADGPPEMGARPGDDFNRRGDVRAVLAQCGWSCVRGGNNEYWPPARQGFGHLRDAEGPGLLRLLVQCRAVRAQPGVFAIRRLHPAPPWRRFRTGGVLPRTAWLRQRFSGG